MGVSLLDLSEDILLIIVYHLDVADVLSIRKTCRRLDEITRYRSIWRKACNSSVIEQGLPFPYKSLDEISAVELERWTRRALAFREVWTREDRQPRRTLSFEGGPLNGLRSVHFVFRHGREWIIAVSEGIWPVITCWDLQRVDNGAPTKVGEWSCRGATILDVAVDSNLTNDACLAVAVDNYTESNRYIEIQRIKMLANSRNVVFQTVAVLDTDHIPVQLDGDVLAISDEFSETRVVNWKTEEYAILKSNGDGDDVIQHNKCLQVLFAHECVFVARSRSIDLFPEVRLCSPKETAAIVYPLKTCTFGWIDGIAISPVLSPMPEYRYPPVAILIRAEQGDPWASDIHSVKYYIVYPDPDYDSTGGSSTTESGCPYKFPPDYYTSIAAKREFMRCPKLALGPAGTSVWVGGIGSGRIQELWSMIWPGAIRNLTEPRQVLFSKLLKTAGSGGELWTSLDYVESRGCLALGSVDGRVTVLYMVD